MTMDHLDHLVLATVREAACLRFCTQVPRMRPESIVGGTPSVERKAFRRDLNLIEISEPA